METTYPVHPDGKEKGVRISSSLSPLSFSRRGAGGEVSSLQLKGAKYLSIAFHIFILAFIYTPLNAQTSLDYYIQKAYNNNPVIKENTNNIKINATEKQLIEAQYSSPQVSLTSNYLFTPFFNSEGKIINNVPSPQAIGYDDAITNGGLYSILLNLDKNIFNQKTVEAYQKEFDVSTQKINFDITSTKHQIDKDITTQYLKCLQQLKLYSINEEIIKIIDDELTIMRSLVENGMIKQSDYIQLKIEADNQRINSKQILSDYYRELLQLNNLCGIADTTFRSLNTISLTFENIKSESNFFRQYSLDSLRLYATREAFEAKYNPVLNVFVNAGLNAVALDNIQRRFGMSAGFNLSWVLMDGDQKSLNRQKTELSLMNIDIYKTNYLTGRENQLSIAAKQIELNRNMLAGIRSQLAIYKDLLEVLRLQLSNGQLSVVDYLVTLRNYIELQKTEITAEINEQLSINEYNYWNW
jgi:outer membrane protein TolC